MLEYKIESLPFAITKETHEELKNDLKTTCEFTRQEGWKVAYEQLEEIRHILIYNKPLTEDDISRIKFLFLKSWGSDFSSSVAHMVYTDEELKTRSDRIEDLARLVDIK